MQQQSNLKERGFTLIEMMVVIGIIAILSAVAIPAYQNYLRKAALTDMLQSFTPYRTAVELCAIDNGGLTACNAGQQGIPAAKSSNYVGSITISQGVVTLSGQKSLNGLQVVLTPVFDNKDGMIDWQRQCNTKGDDSLKQSCENIFRLNQASASAGSTT